MAQTSHKTTRPTLPPGALLSSALAAALAAMLFWGPLRPAMPAATTAANVTVRDLSRAETLLALRNWPRLQSSQFTIYYAPGLSHDAAIAAAAARRYYPQVLSDYGLPQNGTLATLVVLGPEQMTRFVGSASTDPPLGAYYHGIVWLLAPSDFLQAGADEAQRYASDGPVAHELTHLADDLVSGGRTPAWLDEGLAQYEEWRLSGWVWVQSNNDFASGTYSWTQLTQSFDQLPNIALAYRQALAATASICRTGPGACKTVLHKLRAGASLNAALLQTIGQARLTGLQTGADWKPGLGPEPGAPAGPVP